MKLIRLESDNATPLSKSTFTNYMSQPLQIKPRSKICLKCITIQFSSPPLIIDSSNDTLSVQANAGGADPSTTITVKLERKQYLTIEDLCSEIQFKLNSTLQSYYYLPDVDGPSTGLEFLVSAVSDPATYGSKVTIAFNRADVTYPAQTDILYTKDTVEVNGINFQKIGTAPNTGLYNGLVQIESSSLNEGGWTYGLTISPQTVGQLQSIGDSVWELVVRQNATGETLHGAGCDGVSVYKFWYNNQWNQSTIQVEEQDKIRVCKDIIFADGIQVKYLIQRADDTVEYALGDFTTTIPHTLYQNNIVSVRIANDTGKIAFNNIYFIPTTNELNDSGVVTKKVASMVQTVHRNKNLKASASNVQIVLSSGLARLLGYKNNTLTQNTVSGSWTASEDVTTNFFDNDFIVTIPEIPSAGYNHGSKRIENMVAVITSSSIGKSTNATGFERYEMSWEEMANFVFVSVGNNQNSISIPSLTIEVKSNGKLLDIDGKMSCLLLLTEDEEDK
jgi:hypothetical protein